MHTQTICIYILKAYTVPRFYNIYLYIVHHCLREKAVSFLSLYVYIYMYLTNANVKMRKKNKTKQKRKIARAHTQDERKSKERASKREMK